MKLALILMMAGSLLGADGPKENEIKKEMKKLNGTWVVERTVVWGQESPDVKGKFSWIIQGETLSTKGKGQDKAEKAKGAIRIDPSKTPKTIDVTVAEGENKGLSILGIYELDGTTLKICHAAGSRSRPKEFSSTAENKQGIVVMKRQKP